MLEAQCHPQSLWATHTYTDEQLPSGGVQKRHLQLLFKRLRRAGLSFRYYAVGEYGDHTRRPHYHVAYFGLGLEHVPVLTDCWVDSEGESRGHTFVGDCTPASLAYSCHHITRRLPGYAHRLPDGAEPEFSLMSRNPGLGALAVPDLVDVATSRSGSIMLATKGDVFDVLRFDGQRWPIARYLRRKLRAGLGMDDKVPDTAQAGRRVEYSQRYYGDAQLDAGQVYRGARAGELRSVKREQERIQSGRKAKSQQRRIAARKTL